ncbi:FG-GAP and VCBS repeat-containing protein [Streptomyces sp. NPDC048717]|uniref:FG-GAP and VCBS repeat-containing protein n=1 Tax=Streptomyces sp. NPDC048717 TaxID=3154928 RepID=UPI0034416524
MRPTRPAVVTAVLAALAAGLFAAAQPSVAASSAASPPPPPLPASDSASLSASTSAPLSASAAPARLSDDFNGDGHRDLVLLHGTYQQDHRVDVVYGTASGPGTRVQTIYQDLPNIPGITEQFEGFGQAATSADLDRDGYADLVVATPHEKVGTVSDRGGLTVVWGGPRGLGYGTVFHSPVPLEGKDKNWGDSFGSLVTAGDFDGDGDQDLVARSDSKAGVLVLLKGPFTRTGKTAGHEFLGKNFPRPVRVDGLIAGRVDGDRATDLYILGWSVGEGDEDERVYFHRGGAGFATRAATFRVPDPTITTMGSSQAFALALGDFDKDGHGDLAIGRGTEPVDKGRGYVIVQYGGPAGPDTARPMARFTQDTPGVPGDPEDGDYFGMALAAGDVNGDGYADLAVAAPGENLGPSGRNAGMVTVLYGRAGGLTGAGARVYDQNKPGILGVIERNDYFGRELRMADYTRDGRADLMVQTRDEVGKTFGMIHLLKGSPSGITGTGSKIYNVPSLKLPYDNIGSAFAG